MSSRNFIINFLGLLALGFTSLLLALLWRNPFDLFDWPMRAASPKPMHTHVEVFKMRMIEKFKPDLIVFGNSRAEVGIPVNEEVTGFSNGVNAAISGGTLPEMIRLAEHALATGQPRVFLFVIDPNSFTQSSVRQSFDLLAIGKNPSGYEKLWRRVLFHAHWKYLWNETQATLNPSMRPTPFLEGDRGMRSEASMKMQLAEDGGAEKASLKWELNFTRPAKNFKSISAINISSFKNLLSKACNQGVRVVTLLPPMHVRMLRIWEKSYGTEYMREWLAEISLNDDNHNKCASYQAWSAIEISAITTETFEPNDARNYWESSHFRQHLGADVISHIFLNTNPKYIKPHILSPSGISRIFKQLQY